MPAKKNPGVEILFDSFDMPIAIDLYADIVDNCKVRKSTGCLIWQGSKNGPRRDRPNKGLFDGSRHRTMRVHRLMYCLANGMPFNHIDDQVHHHCDVPQCVNPDHLYEGTQQDNVNDMHKRGRAKYTGAKLNYEDAEEIRFLYDNGKGWNAPTLAREFNVTADSIYRILNNDAYKDA